MKRIFALVLTLLMSLSLVACGNAKDDTSDGAETDNYPEKPITVIVPFSAGGEHDLTARTIATRLHDMFGWTVVIQNTSGDSAATIEYMKDSGNADGYTLFMHSPEVMASGFVSGQLNEDYYKQFTYLGCFVYDPLCISVAADSPFNTIEELFAYAKEHPGELNWAAVGAGGFNQMNSENLWSVAGCEFNYVPYDDASKSRAAVLGGHADVFCSFASGAKSSISSGELKALAVGSSERLDFWPEVPTLKEVGCDLQVGLTRCWDIHPDTPQEIVDILTEKLHECLNDADTQAKLLEMGQNPNWMTNEEMHEYGEYYYGVYQEIYARLILFNFSKSVSSHASVSKNKRKKYKHAYKINFNMAVHICRLFLKRSCDMHPLDVIGWIQQYLRVEKEPGRSFLRNLRGIGAVSFFYRLS